MTEAIAQNKQQLAERIGEIHSDRDLSEEAKERYIKEAYSEASERHAELIEQRDQENAQELQRLERGVFSLSYPDHVITERDRESYRHGYRDAAFRVLDMDPERLERVLSRAERVGDGQLAQAIYHEAVERGLSLANEYRQSRPDARKKWDRYVDARRAVESPEGILRSAMSGQGPEKPRELGGVG